MRQALAEHFREDLSDGDRYALAIEPDDSQARSLEQLLEGRIGGALRVVGSTEQACSSLAERIPDLILMSPLLAPQEEEQIVARLAAIGVGASHVQLLSIPRVVDEAPPERKRRFGWQAQKSPSSTGGIGDLSSFVKDVAEYLAQASNLRQPDETADPHRPAPELPAGNGADKDTLAGLRLEHIEQLLDRLDADSSPQSSTTNVSIPERDLTAMATTQDATVETPREGAAKLPRFLHLSEPVPLPLRALLDEAEGCLKMAFMTGAGACAARTLDLLLAEQGLGGADRSDQIQQLGKKHPAAESFLRGLALAMNNPSGAWDESRVTLAVVILKAIAYEIYVLGPERKERTAYVIELLERFKAAGRS
jgi:hypothetical protein